MRKLLIATLLMGACLCAYAGFGGSRSSFSGSRSSFSSSRSSSSFSSSPSRSSFGGFRSSGSPATISRPYVQPTVVNRTTVIHTNNGYRSSNSGFVTGMVVGSALSQPRTVIVQRPVYVDQPVVQQSYMAQPVNTETHWFVGIVVVIVIAAVFISVVVI